MKNPFADLGQAREERERKQREHLQEIKKRVETRYATIAKYHPMISQILRDLVQAVYPNGRVESPSLTSNERNQYEMPHSIWCIERGSGEDTQTVVTVSLTLDEQDKPIELSCERHTYPYGTPVRIGLSADELVRALRSLHPQDTV